MLNKHVKQSYSLITEFAGTHFVCFTIQYSIPSRNRADNLHAYHLVQVQTVAQGISSNYLNNVEICNVAKCKEKVLYYNLISRGSSTSTVPMYEYITLINFDILSC